MDEWKKPSDVMGGAKSGDEARAWARARIKAAMDKWAAKQAAPKSQAERIRLQLRAKGGRR